SAIFAEFPPLPTGAEPNPRSTMPDAAPSPRKPDDTLDESVLFDPEAALISRAPRRAAANEGSEDTLTVPLRGSLPPSAPPASAAKPPPVARKISTRVSQVPIPRDEPELPANLPDDPKI